MSLQSPRPIWLDCDPGHDDAIALLLALFASNQSSTAPAFDLLGVSTVHGNASGSGTYLNAVRLLSAYKIPPTTCKVWRGADVPLLRQAKADVGIHGESGLDGVECLPDVADDLVQSHLSNEQGKPGTTLQSSSGLLPPADPLTLVQHQIDLLQSRRNRQLPPIALIATGPLTNVALLIKMCPGQGLELLTSTIEKIVIMGGSAGVPGNRTPLAGSWKRSRYHKERMTPC
jgi:inosine-uridine nucleoside N-ribohydrolase